MFLPAAQLPLRLFADRAQRLFHQIDGLGRDEQGEGQLGEDRVRLAQLRLRPPDGLIACTLKHSAAR